MLKSFVSYYAHIYILSPWVRDHPCPAWQPESAFLQPPSWLFHLGFPDSNFRNLWTPATAGSPGRIGVEGHSHPSAAPLHQRFPRFPPGTVFLTGSRQLAAVLASVGVAWQGAAQHLAPLASRQIEHRTCVRCICAYLHSCRVQCQPAAHPARWPASQAGPPARQRGPLPG